jgi:hypothetical protein
VSGLLEALLDSAAVEAPGPGDSAAVEAPGPGDSAAVEAPGPGAGQGSDADEMWLEAVVGALLEGDAPSRHGLGIYVLPSIAGRRPDGLARLAQRLELRGGAGGAAAWALTAVLKVARRLGVADRLPGPGGEAAGGGGRREVVARALVDVREELRLNGLEMVCLCSRNSEMPSDEDLDMVRGPQMRRACVRVLACAYVRVLV